VFHDADASRLCGSALRIGRSSIAELGLLRLGEGTIPTLESLVELVAGRVPLLLEVKVDGDLWRWAPGLRRAFSGYRGAFGIMSFDPRLPRLLKTKWPTARRGLVVRHGLSPLKRAIAMRLAAPHFLAVDRAALGQSWVASARQRIPVYSWTIRTAAESVQAAVQADALIWEADGRP
jgi:glycerophosphoryl diester phosphodiesterase